MRKFALLLATAGFMLAGCTSTGQLDPTAIAALIKTACGIAVPVADVVAIIDADKGNTAKAIVDVVCSAYKSSLTREATGTRARAAAGETVPLTILVNGKEIKINVTPL